MQISEDAKKKANLYLNDREQKATLEMAQELEEVPLNAVVAKFSVRTSAASRKCQYKHFFINKKI